MEDARIPGGSHLAEVAGRKTGADIVKLRVVEAVEALRTKFNTASAGFIQDELLKERDIPVVAPGTAKSVLAQIAPLSDRRSGEYAGVEPFRDCSGVASRAVYVRAIGRTG